MEPDYILSGMTQWVFHELCGLKLAFTLIDTISRKMGTEFLDEGLPFSV